MSFFALIFLFLLGFILWPVIKFGWKLFTIRRQLNNIYGQRAGGGASGGGGSFWNRSGRPQSPKAKRSRIDRNVGEYVEFEELAVDVEAETQRQYKKVEFERQQQISDVEWEEVR